jgi:tetratricopeptide (TPR) repeat protein
MMDKSTSNKKNVVDHSTLDVKGNLHIGDVTYIINEKKVTIPHLLTNNIPSNAERILGRDKELTTIATHLADNLPTVLVNGIGGIGKTSVAAKYVVTFGHAYKHLAWLTVQSSLVEAFTNDIVLLKSLHIEQDVRQLIETQRLTDAFKLVVHQLNTLENTLVVLDNANDVADLMDNKNLFDTAKCHYLITSRTQLQDWTIVPIDVLSEDEAVALFRKIAPSVSPDPKGENVSDKALKSLLFKLFYHTLLIELVAKAVENAGFSFEALQKMVETQFIHDENLNEDIVPTGKHGDNYEAKRAKIEEYIWLIFSNVKDLGDDAKQILRGMALLPAATPFDRDFLKTHLAMFDVKEIVPNLSLLVEWGWLEKEQNKTFKMHPLIVDVVMKHLEVNAKYAEKYILNTANRINFRIINPEHNLFKSKQYEMFAERLFQIFFQSDTEGVAFLLDRLGYLNEYFGLYPKALKLKERSLFIVENNLEIDRKAVFEYQNNVANLYDALGRYEEAAYLFEQSMLGVEKYLASDDPIMSVRLLNLSNVYQHMGRHKEAMQLLERALKNDIKHLGEHHPKVALDKTSLGLVYFRLGLRVEGISLVAEALISDARNYERNHPEIAQKKANLGTMFHVMGMYDAATELLEEALESDKRNFGEDHPSIADRKFNLAFVYKDLGQAKKALRFLKEAYSTYLKTLGENHPNTILVKDYLGR